MNSPNPAASNRTSRREFLKTSTVLAAGAFPLLIESSVLGRDGAVAPSNRITLGVVGGGPQGVGDMTNFLNQADCQVVAVCDLKKDRLEIARDTVNKHYQNQDCRVYHDFRELTSRKDIDACLIATSDHWHMLVALAAVKSGKDIYVEKPLNRRMEEGFALRRALREHRRVFQFGTQQRSVRTFRQACELVRNGHIGPLRHINVWGPGSTPGGSLQQVLPPAGLDYDFWLGPAPVRPYTENLCTADNPTKTWWFVSDFALGFIAGWGIHPMDIAAWGGDELLGGTVTVEGRGNFRTAEGVCDTATIWEVDYSFASGLTLKFVGTPIGGTPSIGSRLVSNPTGEPFLHGDEWRQRYRRISLHGTAFEGAAGWVHVDRTGINLQPEDLIDVRPETFKIQLPHSSNHARNFLDCVKSRGETICPIDAAMRGEILCHLADIAIRLGRKVTFDFKQEKFVHDDAANQRLKADTQRKPWHL
jgi:predicted dehydrogenase